MKMAKYNIKNLNYISTGEDRSFINMDIELGYEIYDYIHFLCAETSSNGYLNMHDKIDQKNLTVLSHDIGTEQCDGFYYKADYIQKECSDPLAQEQSLSQIILNEQQENFIEADSSKRKYIRLYLSCCTIEMRQKIDEFNKNRTHLNVSYLIDKLENDKNNLTCQGNVLQNMYDMVDVSIKKQGIHDQVNNYLHYLDYHHDIYAPQLSTGILGFCQTQQNDQYKNDVLMVTPSIKAKNYSLMTDLKDRRISDDVECIYGIALENLKNTSYTYNVGIDSLSVGRIGHFIPKRNFSNMNYSYVIDVPVDSTNVEDSRAKSARDYDLGEIMFYRMHTCKNAFNSLYTMEMSEFNEIDNCRTYQQVNTFAGQPYLKYYDDITYKGISEKENSDGLIDINLQEYNSVTDSTSDRSTKPFQKIELLCPTDYTNNAKHKANIFTVNILSTGIEEVEDEISEKDGTEQLKMKISQLKTDIHSAIKEIARNICPANTQLFNVYFGGIQ